MFERTILENYIPFQPSEEKWQEIEQLEDCNHTLNSRYPNLTGKQYERLTVLGKGPTEHTTSGKSFGRWWTICSCKEHNIVLARTGNLNSGNTKSCGCWDREVAAIKCSELGKKAKLDIAGKRFGKLIAIEPTEERRGKSIVWKCQCDCGNTFYAPTNGLNAGRATHCGCVTKSRGERKIQQILEENNIPYISEKTFADCIFSDTRARARFDFYINDSFLLEYDGEQHFKESSDYFANSLEKRQEHDRIKNEYCKEHNIPLVRIPYTELDNIDLDMIMGDKYLVNL